MPLEDHELKVKHKSTGAEMVVSKRLYHNSPDEYEVVEGEPGKSPDADEFKLPVNPPTKLEKQVDENKMDEGTDTEDKKPAKPAKPSKLPPPAL